MMPYIESASVKRRGLDKGYNPLDHDVALQAPRGFVFFHSRGAFMVYISPAGLMTKVLGFLTLISQLLLVILWGDDND